MINTPYKQLEKGDNQLHPGVQLLLFIVVFLIVFIVGNLIGIGVITLLYGSDTLSAVGSLKTSVPHFVNALWILQIIGTTFPIFSAPVFFAYVIVRDPGDYIKPNFRFPLGLLFLVLFIMFLSNPVIEVLSNINQKMVLPQWLKWMKDSEDNAPKDNSSNAEYEKRWRCNCECAGYWPTYRHCRRIYVSGCNANHICPLDEKHPRCHLDHGYFVQCLSHGVFRFFTALITWCVIRLFCGLER